MVLPLTPHAVLRMGRKKSQKAKGEETDRLPLFEGAATSEVGMPRVRSFSSSTKTAADTRSRLRTEAPLPATCPCQPALHSPPRLVRMARSSFSSPFVTDEVASRPLQPSFAGAGGLVDPLSRFL